MNNVCLIGRLTKDIDLREGNVKVGKFTLAVNRMKKDDGADFINCVAFGNTAETMAKYLSKGRQIALEGRIQTGSYDHKDGYKVYTTEVMVNRFEFIADGSNSNSNNNNNNSSDDNYMVPDDGGDIPF